MAAMDQVNIRALLDDAKCYEIVRLTRWPGVCAVRAAISVR